MSNIVLTTIILFAVFGLVFQIGFQFIFRRKFC